ncbi:MAG: hypothetical protein AB7D37_10915 [Desulfovibrio sp.]
MAKLPGFIRPGPLQYEYGPVWKVSVPIIVDTKHPDFALLLAKTILQLIIDRESGK